MFLALVQGPAVELEACDLLREVAKSPEDAIEIVKHRGIASCDGLHAAHGFLAVHRVPPFVLFGEGGELTPLPLFELGLPGLGEPLLAVLALPGLFGLTGVLVGPLDELNVGGSAVGASRRRLGGELLLDPVGELAVLAELLRLELGVEDLPPAAVGKRAGDLLADGSEVGVDLGQGVGKDVYPGLSAVDGDLDLGVVPGGLSVRHRGPPCLCRASHPG